MKAIADSIVSPQSILPPEKIMLTNLFDILVNYTKELTNFFVRVLHQAVQLFIFAELRGILLLQYAKT